MTEPTTSVGGVDREIAADLRKTLLSLELILKDALLLLGHKSQSPPRCSSHATLRDPMVSRLDGLSKSVVKLKEDLERSTTIVCPKCGLYNLGDPAIPQLKRRAIHDGAQQNRPSKRRQTDNGSIAQPGHQPDGLDLPGSPDALMQHVPLEGVAKNALAAFADDGNLDHVGAEDSVDADEHESVADDDMRRDGSQADDVAVDTNIVAEHDWERASILGNSSSVASPSPSPSPSPSSPPSTPHSATPSSSAPHFQSTPPSSLDHQSSTTRCLHARNRPKSSTASQPFSPSSTRAPASVARDRALEEAASQGIISTMIKELLRADPLCKVPRFDRISPPDARVFKLAAAIRSRDAVKQFFDLVSAKRNLQLYNHLFPKCAGAAERLVILQGIRNSSKTVKFVNQYLFAAEIEKARDGGLRVSPNIKRDVMQASGLGPHQYDYHLRLGMQWKKICGVFEGLLCFIVTDKHNLNVLEFHKWIITL